MADFYTFALDGVDAAEYGVHLSGPVAVSGLMPSISRQAVDGRNGYLLGPLRSYKNRTGKVKAYILGDNVDRLLTAVNNWLLSDLGYRRLELSQDPDHYWLASVTRAAQTAVVANALRQQEGTLAPFKIEFDIMPQHFVKNPDDIFIDCAKQPSPVSIYNPYGGNARPLIQVVGESSKNAVFRIGEKVFEIRQFTDKRFQLFADCETMEAYSMDTGGSKIPQDANIRCLDFPELLPGKNEIFFQGLSKIVIKPRWWDK